MNPNVNPYPYGYPPPFPPPQKKKMTPGKWIAIFVPIGVVALALTIFMTILFIVALGNRILHQASQTEQYEIALEYLTESDTLQKIETEDTTLTFTAYSSTHFNDKTEYEFTFETEKASYIIVVRDDGNGLYVVEDECSYTLYTKNKTFPLGKAFFLLL